MDDLYDQLERVEDEVAQVTAGSAVDVRKFQRARLRLDLLRARVLVQLTEQLGEDDD